MQNDENRAAQADCRKIFENKALGNWQIAIGRTRQRPRRPKSFGIGILGGIRVKISGIEATRLAASLIFIGFLRTEPLKPAKYWDLIGIYPPDPQ
jgi:hypothetical protein